MELGHAPVVEHLAAPHGVAEVDLPVVLGLDVPEGGGDAALGHHRVGLAQQRLAHQGGAQPHGLRLDGRPQAGAAGTDDDDVEVVGLVLSHWSDTPLEVEAVVVDGPAGHQPNVEVGEGHEAQAHPGEQHVPAVQGGEELPDPVPDGGLGELLDPTTAQMAACMAAERVRPQEEGVDQQHRGPDAEPEADAGLTEGHEGVDGQDDVEHQAGIEEVPVDVLQQQRKSRLTAVGAVCVGDRAGGRRHPERPVVGLAVVVAGQPESEGEDQDEQGGGDRPPGDDRARVASGHAALGEARRVERRDEVAVEARTGVVVLVHERRPAGVADEQGEHGGRDDLLNPPSVLAEGRHGGTAPDPSQNDRCTRGTRRFLQTGQFASPSSGSSGHGGPPRAEVFRARSLVDHHLSIPGRWVRNRARPAGQRRASTLHCGIPPRRLDCMTAPDRSDHPEALLGSLDLSTRLTPPPDITTLGRLRQAGWSSIPVAEEIRRNASARIAAGQPLVSGVLGFDDTVLPQLENAMMAGHDVILLGERGQAKTRTIRSLVGLLDEWLPIVAHSEINDDPFHPISRFAKDLLAEAGDDLPVSWVHRSERYGEKLATPDTSIADLIGEVDPIRVAEGRYLSDELTIHYGLVPRLNRGIFAVNELPDLAERIQVGLLNVLEERDVQIRGHRVRLPLDIVLLATANPEDYTNRGRIITPLKDRFGAQIRTHYPLDAETELRIAQVEARLPGTSEGAPDNGADAGPGLPLSLIHISEP